MRRTALQLVVVALLVAAVATGGFGAFAATGNDITACAKKKGRNKGALRLASKCKHSERKVRWSVQGPAGPPGPKGDTGGAPTGAVMYFDLPSCPAGWTEYGAGRGRYLVGLPAGGTAGATVGTALSDQEDRPTGQHTHDVNDPGHSHTVAFDNDKYQNLGGVIAGTAPFGILNGSATTSTDFTGITIQPAGLVPGTNAPYVQLLVCRKD